jgi:hypothetical protein
MLIRRTLWAALVLSFTMASQAEAAGRRGSSPVYRGTWSSQTTGHQGTLRMRVLENSGSTVRVRFTGTFLGVVPFVYSTPMTVTGRTADGGMTLYGQSQLPIFGEFRSSAYMNGSQFQATYTSSRDRGQFNMRR